MIRQFTRTVRRVFKLGVAVGALAGTAYGVTKVLAWKRAPEPMLVPVPSPPRRVPTPAPAPAGDLADAAPPTEGAPTAGGGPTEDTGSTAQESAADGDAPRAPHADTKPAPTKPVGKRVSTGRAKSPNKARVVTGQSLETAAEPDPPVADKPVAEPAGAETESDEAVAQVPEPESAEPES